MDNEELLNPEEQDDIIELVDEEGQSVFFERLASFRFNDTDYLALLPTEEDEEDEEAESLNVIIMKIELDEDGNDIIVVPDEEEADEAFEYFVNLVDEQDGELE